MSGILHVVLNINNVIMVASRIKNEFEKIKKKLFTEIYRNVKPANCKQTNKQTSDEILHFRGQDKISNHGHQVMHVCQRLDQ